MVLVGALFKEVCDVAWEVVIFVVVVLAVVLLDVVEVTVEFKVVLKLASVVKVK